ncbi:MAG: cation-transporting P-type ATPase [Desulforhopalus sp.]
MDKQNNQNQAEDRSARRAEDVLHQLDFNSNQGLSQEEVFKRQGHYGPNELQEELHPVHTLFWSINSKALSF